MHVRYPIGLRSTPAPGAGTFAVLFALESGARALLATIIAVQALQIVHTARNVSVLYCTVGVVGLTGSLLIPRLVQRIGRRWTYTLGIAALVLAAGAFSTVTLPGQALGMLSRVFGVACLNIVTSLYIMQYIDRRQLTRSEPLRLQVSALAWAAGPTAGMLLYRYAGPGWAFGASAAAATLLCAVFWILRLAEQTPLVAAKQPPPRPLGNVRRFVAQPRLRLAWLITFGRSSWWAFFFVYAPIYSIHSGFGEIAGALLVSAGNAMLLLTPVYGRLARRYGLRNVLQVAYVVSGISTIAASVLFAIPLLASALLLTGALGCVALDAVGNIPFFRSVRPRERAQMTSVFRTYIDFSELLPPAIFAVTLTFFPLNAVFVLMGVAMLVTAWFARYLPGSM